jgi:hypothetical protein
MLFYSSCHLIQNYFKMSLPRSPPFPAFWDLDFSMVVTHSTCSLIYASSYMNLLPHPLSQTTTFIAPDYLAEVRPKGNYFPINLVRINSDFIHRVQTFY